MARRVRGSGERTTERTEEELERLNLELEKAQATVKKSGDSFGKFGASLESFLLSPLTGNLQQVLSNVQSLATSTFGASAQSTAGSLFGGGGAEAVRRLRDASGTIAATNATEGELESLAEQYGRAGVTLDRQSVEALRPRLQSRNELIQRNQRTVADVVQEATSESAANRIVKTQSDLEFLIKGGLGSFWRDLFGGQRSQLKANAGAQTK